jgi:hypothetical protein
MAMNQPKVIIYIRISESDILRKKIKFVSQMMKMQRVLREQNENIVQLKGACPDNKLPPGLLLQGKQAINDGNNLHNYQSPLAILKCQANRRY